MNRTIFVFLALILLCACSICEGATYQIIVKSDDPAVVQATNKVLLARFQRVLPSALSTVESEISGSTISYTFQRGTPDESIVSYLSVTPGRFSVSFAEPEANDPWITDRDIMRVDAETSRNDSMIQIHLTEDAGERVQKITSRNLGKSAVVKLDYEKIMEAEIRGAFGRSFQITAPSGKDPNVVAAILEGGRLPATVLAK